MKRYGLTQADYDALLDEQGGVCWICGSNDKLHVDHDHDTGKVRGLLCSPCNVGLGYFKDDPTALRRAAAYVNRR